MQHFSASNESDRPSDATPVLNTGRRAFMVAAAAVALSGCVSARNTDTPMINAIKMLWRGTTPKPVDRAYVAALPYASMLARLNAGPWALLVLASGQNEGLGWYSAERQLLITRGPWVTTTVGLEKNVDATNNFNVNPETINIAKLPADFVVYRSLDSVSLREFSVAVESTFENKGPETIEILDQQYTLSRVVERVRIPLFDADFENYFWVDPNTGYCWRSEQSLMPEVARITYEIAKPPAV